MTQGQHTDRLLGESPGFMEVLERVSQMANLNKPVLIVGERGTGKELIAARLHYLSGRWDQEFIKMNCAAISESLMETEHHWYRKNSCGLLNTASLNESVAVKRW
jgi:psp operon transcriptional activator